MFLQTNNDKIAALRQHFTTFFLLIAKHLAQLCIKTTPYNLFFS